MPQPRACCCGGYPVILSAIGFDYSKNNLNYYNRRCNFVVKFEIVKCSCAVVCPDIQ